VKGTSEATGIKTEQDSSIKLIDDAALWFDLQEIVEIHRKKINCPPAFPFSSLKLIKSSGLAFRGEKRGL
jgi:hypothetical protein